MKELFKHKFVLLTIVVFSASAFGQTSEAIEKELGGLYGKINENSAYSSNSDGELLEKSNEEFKQKLLNHTKIASTLKHKFSELEKEISITTSEDGKFRVYSWDRLDGGTMHFFETVYQFQGADGRVYSKSNDLEEGDSGSFVYEIFEVEAKTEKIYLVCSTSILSTSDAYQSVNLFEIENNLLNSNIKLIKTKTKLNNSLGFEYDFFSVVDRKERPIKLILFDKKTKTISIPVVIDDTKFQYGKVTNKFISYKFNGTYFVKVN